jgi:tRNA threonylcarbamoyl adenosine modification protein YeaZ
MIKKKELLTYIYINTSDDLKTEVWVIKVWSKKTLGSDDIFVKKYEELDPKSHLKFLVPLIKKALEENSIKFSDLDFIAVNEGPGSWTGLRIGASTVKVLCFVNDLPLISVNNFEMMKKAQNYKHGMYLVRCSSVNFYYSKKRINLNNICFSHMCINKI